MRFVSDLTEEQAEALQRRWRTGRSHRERQRAHAVLLSAKGYALEQCADVLGVDRDAVSRWLDRWEKGGAEALAEGARPGRPRALDQGARNDLVAAAAANPASPLRELAKRGR